MVGTGRLQRNTVDQRVNLDLIQSGDELRKQVISRDREVALKPLPQNFQVSLSQETDTDNAL